MSERDAEPWASGHLSYAGWVPNVRSHLSFSRIGAGRSATSFTAPLPGARTRVVLVQASRKSNDYPLWTWLAGLLFPDIRLNWFVDAETAATDLPVVRGFEISIERDRQGVLCGSITLVPRQPDRRDRAIAYENRRKIVRELSRPRQQVSAAQISALRLTCRTLVEDSGFTIRLCFALMRTGECRIWFPEQASNLAPDEHDWVAEQAYYLLKDVAHDHTHHDPSDDQITPLIRFNPKSVEVGHEDEVAWRRETMWSLSREIERRNREGGLVEQRQALGIIAYAEAFQDSLMTHVRVSDQEKKFDLSAAIHDFDFKYLKDSVKASIDVASTKLAQAIQITIAAAATSISSVALASSLISTHNGGIAHDDPHRVKLGLWEGVIPLLAAHPIFVGLASAVLLLVVVGILIADGPAGLYNSAQRTFSQFGRAWSITWFDSPLKSWLFLLAYHLVGIGVAGYCTYGAVWLISTGGYW